MSNLCIVSTPRIYRIWTTTLAVVALIFLATLNAAAQTETVIYNFGNSPYSGLSMDAAGNLYGVNWGDGSDYNGFVFRLSPSASGWQTTVLYNFTGGDDGATPYATPIPDAAGNLYGTTTLGGAHSSGVVYKLSPSSSGWQESVLYAFTGGRDGSNPSNANLVFDQAGNLYGSNVGGGNMTSQACQNTSGCGAIYQLSPAENGKWNFRLLHEFSGGRDGVGPAWLAFDSTGTLFGGAAGAWGGFNGPNEPGLIFKLTPTAQGLWSDTSIYQFRGNTDGGLPGIPRFDAAGNIYGTGTEGGILSGCGGSGCGVVFKISPTSSSGWKESVIYDFKGTPDGSEPEGLILFHGKLYGTTYSGGPNGYGVVFELSPSSNGWTESTVLDFDGTNGGYGDSPLVINSQGNLFGTAQYGGRIGAGVAFEIVP